MGLETQAARGQRLHVSSWGGKAMWPWWEMQRSCMCLKGEYISSLLALMG